MRSGELLELDLARENAVARRLEQEWDVRLVKGADTARVDYAAVRGDEIVGLVEIKGRFIPSTEYSTTTFDAEKLAHLRYLGACFGVPALVVFQWTDKAGYLHADRVVPEKYDEAATRKGDDPKVQAYVPMRDIRPLWDGDALLEEAS